MNSKISFTGLVKRFRRNQNLCILKCVVTIFIVSTGNLYAQDFALAGLEYINYAKSDIKEASDNQQSSIQEFSAFVNIPAQFNNNETVFINGLRYAYVENTSYNSPLFATTEKLIKLHVIAYTLTMAQKLSSQWTFMAIVRPTLASDFKEKLSGDDLIIQVAALASTKISSKMHLGGGLTYSTHLGEPLILPAVQVKYIDHNHELSAFLPFEIGYSYKIGIEALKIGLKAVTNGANFNVTTQDFSDIIPSPINKIKYSRTNIGLFLNYRLTKIIRMDAYAGITVARKFQLVDFDEKEYEYGQSNGPFFKLGMTILSPGKSNNSQISRASQSHKQREFGNDGSVR